ncbi:MAG: YicC/YloC family endoribonuclease [Acidobacteriota bacterium]
MTGFGRGEASAGRFLVTVELRSVNHRFADLKIKLPSELVGLEQLLQSRVKKVVRRGRLDAVVNVSRQGGSPSPVEINRPLVDSYVRAARELKRQYGLSGEINIQALLSLPEVMRTCSASRPGRAQRSAVVKAFDTALRAHDAMRAREGEILGRDINKRLLMIGRLRERIEKRAPRMVGGYARRLQARIRRLEASKAGRLQPIDGTRVAQETAIAAEKADITEELVRLGGYLQQAGELMTSAREPAGKRLDFIMQEMNREANTINSKAIDISICRDALDIKAEVEKIREQVQNVE